MWQYPLELIFLYTFHVWVKIDFSCRLQVVPIDIKNTTFLKLTDTI